jgi:hypothetical protein
VPAKIARLVKPAPEDRWTAGAWCQSYRVGARRLANLRIVGRQRVDHDHATRASSWRIDSRSLRKNVSICDTSSASIQDEISSLPGLVPWTPLVGVGASLSYFGRPGGTASAGIDVR